MNRIYHGSPMQTKKSQCKGKRMMREMMCTVKILKFGTPQTIAIIVLKLEKFDVTLH